MVFGIWASGSLVKREGEREAIVFVFKFISPKKEIVGSPLSSTNKSFFLFLNKNKNGTQIKKICEAISMEFLELESW